MASLHGYEIDCDRELGRLSDAVGERGSIRIRAARASPLSSEGELLQFVEGRDTAPLYGLARTGPSLVAWHADAGSFAIDAEAMAISYSRADAERAEGELRWDDRLGSTAIPLLAAEQGGLALHASGNLIDGRCLLICAVTGRGKSTLAAALAARGHPLLAEDGLVAHRHDGRAVVWPGMSGALVTKEAAEAIAANAANAAGIGGDPDRRGRVLVTLPAAHGPAAVAAIAILAERGGARVAVERLSRPRAHRELLAHALSGSRVESNFSSAARLVETAPVALVRVPDRIGAIAEAANALASLAKFE
jgi:hypothetical protein